MTEETIKKLSKEEEKEEIDASATGYIDNHNELKKLISDVNTAQGNSDDSFLSLGYQLAAVADEFEKKVTDKKLAKKVFVAIKKQTAEKVNAFDVNTLNKVVKVASNKVISKYRTEQKLPNHWGTLYLLTSLDDEQIEALVDSNEDVANGTNALVNTTRKDLKKIVDSIKGTDPKPKEIKRLIIVRKDGGYIKENDNAKAKLVQFLAKNGWMLHELKAKPSNEPEEQANNEPMND